MEGGGAEPRRRRGDGRRPTALLVALVAAGRVARSLALGLADGLAAACAAGRRRRRGRRPVRRPASWSSPVTALGDLGGPRAGAAVGRPRRRRGGAGRAAGRSAAGLDLLHAGLGGDRGRGRTSWPRSVAPRPPLRGRAPGGRAAGATAMLDVSDGLVRDLGAPGAARPASRLDLTRAAGGRPPAGAPPPGRWPRRASALASRHREPTRARRGARRAGCSAGGEDHALLALLPAGHAAARAVRGRRHGPGPPDDGGRRRCRRRAGASTCPRGGTTSAEHPRRPATGGWPAVAPDSREEPQP